MISTAPVIPPFTHEIGVFNLAAAGINIGWPFGWDDRRHEIDPAPGSSILVKGDGIGISKIGFASVMENASIQIGNLVDTHVTILGCSIYCGERAAIHAGLEQPGYRGSLHLHLIDCEIVARRDSPPPTSYWGVFGYNVFVHYERVKFRCAYLAEHGSYIHNPLGAYIKETTLLGTGSEGLKFTNRAHEGAPAPDGALLYIKGVRGAHWRNPWGWRGGAGIVIQGAQCNVLIEDSILLADEDDVRTLMIDDGGDDRPTDGRLPNGWFIARRSAFYGGRGTENLPPMIGFTQLAGSPEPVVSAAKFKDCAIYGENASIQAGRGAVPAGKFSVEGCNTPEILRLALALGLPDRPEAVIPGPQRVVRVSEGFEA